MASALAALSSAFNPSSAKAEAPKPARSGQGSQRAAAFAALSSVLTAEQKKGGTSTEGGSRSPSPDPSVDRVKEERGGISAEDVLEGWVLRSGTNGADNEAQDTEIEEGGGDRTFTYERLKAKSINPARGIDLKRREAYLSDTEFKTVVGMSKEEFYRQPKWKQDVQKRKVDLF